MTYPYNLPICLPIADKMEIGERTYEEIEWLLEHGEIRSDLVWSYHKLFRPVPGVYQLWKGKNQDDPEKSNEQELVKTTATLQEMLSTPNVIQYWHWLSDQSYDWFPQMREQRNMPFLQKYMKVLCYDQPGQIMGISGSGYIQVYHHEDQHVGLYHPYDGMVYYDDEGAILADYREKKGPNQ